MEELARASSPRCPTNMTEIVVSEHCNRLTHIIGAAKASCFLASARNGGPQPGASPRSSLSVTNSRSAATVATAAPRPVCCSHRWPSFCGSRGAHTESAAIRSASRPPGAVLSSQRADQESSLSCQPLLRVSRGYNQVPSGSHRLLLSSELTDLEMYARESSYSSRTCSVAWLASLQGVASTQACGAT